ncbi:MAG: hypothetical protein K9L76_02940, partial [Candidatus Omnitrophica bacterium]|nr:hypothetical protein [Candidatus Omnitrophota bacterium]
MLNKKISLARLALFVSVFIFIAGANPARAGTLKFEGVPVDITTSSNEDLIIAPGAGGNTQIGDKSGTNSNATTNNDLYVTGVLEADGAAYLDSSLTLGSNLIVNIDDLYVDTSTGYLGIGETSPAVNSLTLGALGTATETSQGYNSRNLTLRGSGWTGTAAENIDIALKFLVGSSTNYGLVLSKAPAATADKGLFCLGPGAWDGSTSGYFAGSSYGTIIAANAASGFSGNLIDLQVAGISKFSVDSEGNIVNTGSSSSSGQTVITSTSTPQLSIRYDSSNKYDISVSSEGAVTLDAGGNSLDIDTAAIDLSTQTVDVTLDDIQDALNFDSNTLSIDASNNRIGIGTASPTAALNVTDSISADSGTTNNITEVSATTPIDTTGTNTHN